jgi:biotin-(acetyl-CoA carboxylase) ligase
MYSKCGINIKVGGEECKKLRASKTKVTIEGGIILPDDLLRELWKSFETARKTFAQENWAKEIIVTRKDSK